MTGAQHTRDEDCTVGEDGTCTGCGVAHGGEPCGTCGGRAYHRVGCAMGDPDSEAELAASRRVTNLRALADQLRRVPTTGATIHDMATIVGLATAAGDIAAQVCAGVAPDDWRLAWLDRAEAQLEVFRTEGLAGWRRVYRKR